jgi:hypothetical protein
MGFRPMTAHEWGVLQPTAAPTDMADIVVKPSTTTGARQNHRRREPSLERETFNKGQTTIMLLKVMLEKDRCKISISREQRQKD